MAEVQRTTTQRRNKHQNTVLTCGNAALHRHVALHGENHMEQLTNEDGTPVRVGDVVGRPIDHTTPDEPVRAIRERTNR